MSRAQSSRSSFADELLGPFESGEAATTGRPVFEDESPWVGDGEEDAEYEDDNIDGDDEDAEEADRAWSGIDASRPLADEYDLEYDDDEWMEEAVDESESDIDDESPDLRWREDGDLQGEAVAVPASSASRQNQLWYDRLDMADHAPSLMELLIDSETGAFGTAIAELQAAEGLTVDGVLGPQTWNRLADDMQRQVAPAGTGRRRDIKFEFELSYGLEKLVGGEPVGVPFLTDRIDDDVVVTTHRKGRDGFAVVMDGPRMEIETRRFGLEDRAELDRIRRAVVAFAEDLEARCRATPPRRIATTDRREGSLRGGRVRDFKHPMLADPDFVAFPIKNSRKQKTWFRQSCRIGASPQVNIDMPLASVMDLVTEIRQSQRGRRKIRLTGTSKSRSGLRSDALYFAHDRVLKSFRQLARSGRVPSSALTKQLAGFMILLVQYLRTSEIRPGPSDWEVFPKAYVPAVTHTHFEAMFSGILTPEERDIFLRFYGRPAVRQTLFDLALNRPGSKDGTATLFPNRTHGKQIAFFGVVLTWDDLVNSAIDPGSPIRLKPDRHGHRAISLPTPFATANRGTATTGPRSARIEGVRLELRRLGYRWWRPSEWEKLMDFCYEMAEDLNGV